MKVTYSKRIKSLLTDYVYWLYMLGSSAFLLKEWAAVTTPDWVILFVPVLLAMSVFLNTSTMSKKIFEASDEVNARWSKTVWGWQLAAILAITFVTGWVVVEIQPVKFLVQFRNAGGILSGLFHPNTSILMEMLSALAETILLALMATVFAIPIAFVLSFFAARNLMPHTLLGNAVYVTIRTISTVVRSIEAIVWAIVFSVWVGIGPFAGMLALMVHSVAALVKLYSEQLENVDNGPIEAIKATGASTLQVWRYAVIPQILSPYLAFTIYRWDINVRMATIVGFVGGGGIGLALQQQQQLLAWRSVGLIMWLIAIVVWVMDMVSGAVRQKLIEN